MKKLMILSSFLFASLITFEFASAAGTSALVAFEQQQENKEKIKKEDLPKAVVDAWNKSDYASSQVKEVTKVTKGQVVTYEISYADATGKTKTATFSADGREIG